MNFSNGAMTYCIHCPGSVNKMIKDFRTNIEKITEDYGKE
jgi:hypothetical protein